MTAIRQAGDDIDDNIRGHRELFLMVSDTAWHGEQAGIGSWSFPSYRAVDETGNGVAKDSALRSGGVGLVCAVFVSSNWTMGMLLTKSGRNGHAIRTWERRDAWRDGKRDERRDGEETGRQAGRGAGLDGNRISE